MGTTYKQAGVDIEAGDAFVERIKPYAARTVRPEAVAGVGGFGGLFALPPGKYRVHLHFAEVFQNIRGCRRFDVLLERTSVLEDFEPLAAGFATAVEKVFDVNVDDGILEVRFVHSSSPDPPKVSAIEVERVE